MGIYLPVYPGSTPLYIPPYAPWVYHHPAVHRAGLRSTDEVLTLPDDKALGSTLRLITVTRRREALILPKV